MSRDDDAQPTDQKVTVRWSYAMTDSTTMLRRNLLHAKRYPGLTMMMIGMPVLMLLLFVFVLGDALGAGIGGMAKGGGDYIDYLTPGIVIMTLAMGPAQTAISVCTDLTEGIIARFRTMAISRTSMLTGHVFGSVIQSMASVVLLLGVAVLAGFRPNASATDWLLALGFLLLLCFSLTWLGVALGLVSKSPEGASNIVMPIMYLPFIGSAFVPTDSMSSGCAGSPSTSRSRRSSRRCAACCSALRSAATAPRPSRGVWRSHSSATCGRGLGSPDRWPPARSGRPLAVPRRTPRTRRWSGR